jgi:conjugative coupling factor TraD (TOL family)
MANDYAIEAWLRPPVELWSSATAIACAGVACFSPWAILMPPEMGNAVAAGLTAFAGLRFVQGYRVVRYQRQMRKLPLFAMKSADIPVSQRKLYLGRGFRWTQKHTQRLRDTLRPEVQRFVEPGSLYRATRQFENAVEHTPVLKTIAAITANRAWWNPVSPLLPLGGKPQIHAVEPREENVYMDLSERVGHKVTYGATRVGKSRYLEICVSQDIRRGDVVIVIDPKGDAGVMKRCYAEAARAGRLDRFYIFHLGYPAISARYNAIGDFSRITQVATRLTNPLPSSGNSAAFREFCWRFANIIARAISALGRKPDYRQILRAINDIEPLFLEYAHHWLSTSGPANWEGELARVRSNVAKQKVPRALEGRSFDAIAVLSFLKKHQIHEPVLENLASVFKYDRTYFDKLVSSLGPLLEKLTSGPVAELLSPDYFNVDDPRPIFDWMKVIRQGGIVYVGLDALTDSAVATAVGNSMFADLVSVGGEIYKYGVDGTDPSTAGDTRVSLHLDEFSDLVGDEFVPMANKIGGAGFQLNIYTQTSADVEAKMGSPAKAEQVIGNMNTIVMFRVKTIATAEQLTSQLPEVDVSALTMVSGVTDASADGSGTDFVSKNEDRVATQTVPLLHPADIMALPKGQAFALLEGGQLWKVRMPLPDPSGDHAMPASLADLADKMQRSYRTGEQWWSGADSGAGNLETLVASDEHDVAATSLENETAA